MNMLKDYSKFMLLSFAVAGILLFIVSIILTYTNVNDNMLTTLVFAIVVASTLMGSTLLARKEKTKGLIKGILFGIVYFLIIYLIAVIFYTGFFVNKAVGMYLLMCVTSGAIGGIVGVNI
ncbi:MAG: TIGR04086 family membrane protein [Clostridia bacterium]|nr:TIGR04086 family membrane protein [Clostridia bacterium]